MNNETGPSREHDAATIARLERLAARRAANQSGTRRAVAEPVGPRADGTAAKAAPAAVRIHRKSPAAAALGLSLATTGGLTYAFAASASASIAVAASSAAGVVATSAANPATTASATATSPTATTATATATGATTAVNGAVYTNRYGAVQIQAVFAADGSLRAVNVLQLPTDNKSVNINNRAVPVLNSEALAAQSAKVHSVSGATYTSTDYVKSLQSAIDTARASGITKLV